MSAPAKLQPHRDRCFRWLSTCNAAVRANLLPSLQMMQGPSFDPGNRIHLPSLTHRSTLDPNAHSQSSYSAGSVTPAKSP